MKNDPLFSFSSPLTKLISLTLFIVLGVFSLLLNFKFEAGILGIIVPVLLLLTFYVIAVKNFLSYTIIVDSESIYLNRKDGFQIPFDKIDGIRLEVIIDYVGGNRKRMWHLNLYNQRGQVIQSILFTPFLGKVATRTRFFQFVKEYYPHIELDEKCEIMAKGNYLPYEKMTLCLAYGFIFVFNLFFVKLLVEQLFFN